MTKSKLTEEELKDIREWVLLSIYADIGKSFLKKFLVIITAAVGALVAALQHWEFFAKLFK